MDNLQDPDRRFECHKDEFENLFYFYKDYLLIENQMVKEEILNENVAYLPNKKLQNYKCIQGVFFLIEKQGYIKKIDFRKSSGCKFISHRQAINAFLRRYKIPRFKTLAEDYKNECMKCALERLPLIDELLQRRIKYFYYIEPTKIMNETQNSKYIH